ncbi:CHAD domain-containing protein [Rhizobium sp. AN80A]|uniref:CHAD domain-containing protein n=1 Tax=Rhizobium sp. AN80A TaxID=3040673 RepID=UPI0024B348C2|nr:CHAD domain-containing protein [Rhizobium sp. AN80A]
MPFSIRPDRSFKSQFRKLARRQLRHAIDVLETRPEGTDHAIHETRKRLKRVRSLYRLVASAVPKFSARENIRLRGIARSLSSLRDAAALVETATYLHERARDSDEAEALGRIVVALTARRDRLIAARRDPETVVSDTIAALKRAIAALDDVSLKGGHRRHGRLLAHGWDTTVRKARKALAACEGHVSAEAFHTLRKRTQDYRAYHKLLNPLWPTAMNAKYEAASALVDMLGRINDLELLCELVETEHHHFENADDLAHLLYAIIFHQQQGRHDALDRAERIFGDDADDEAMRIEMLWIAFGG